MGARSVCLLAVLGACNFMYGLDETRLRESSPRTLVFDNADSGIDLVDFPVMVVPDATFDFDQVADPTTQIRFSDGSGDLPFEIEHWDPAGESVFWVRVPRIPAGSKDTSIEMHFGPDVSGGEAVPAVWTGYDVVAHRATASSVVPDSTGAHAARGTGLVPRAGVIGDAIGFPGLATFDNSTTLFDGWPAFTLEFWLYPDYASAALDGTEPLFIDRDRAIRLGRIYERAFLPKNTVFAQVDWVFATAGGQYTTAYVQVRRWSHITVTYDGQALTIYLNGTFSDIGAVTGPLESGTGSFRLGDASRPFRGMLDELRVSRTAHPFEWVNAQYLSMTRRFVSFL